MYAIGKVYPSRLMSDHFMWMHHFLSDVASDAPRLGLKRLSIFRLFPSPL